MISFLQSHLAPAVTVAALILSTFLVSTRATARHRRLMQNFATAGHAMNVHAEKLKAFVENDSLPVETRLHLISFSETIFEPQEFMEALAKACSDQTSSFDLSGFRKQVRRIEDADAAMVSVFFSAVSSAIVAMLLKTQGASAMLDDHLARMATEEREKAVIYTRIVQKAKRDDDPWGPSTPPLGIAA